jgi:SAM-dependent methyltransferase
MTHEEAVGRWLAGLRTGAEIGAFKTPIPNITPFYIDCFEEYAGEPCLLDFKGSACDLPFCDNSLDYVATSHVLEHVANPLQALNEWARVLKPGGIVYAVIPDKRYTWDRKRTTTPVDHLVADFLAHTNQSDGTHIDEFIDGINWSEYAPGKGEKEREAFRHVLSESVRAGLEINIHFHTFEPGCFGDLIKAANDSKLLRCRYELLTVVEGFPSNVPNGFLIVMRAHKNSARDRVEARVNTAKFMISNSLIVKSGTKSFERRAAPTRMA